MSTQEKQSKVLLSVKGLGVEYEISEKRQGKLGVQKKILKAVDNINFDLLKGEVLGIVGESGCGKSSLSRALLGLQPRTIGTALYNQKTDLLRLTRQEWFPFRKEIQIIFQDPLASLNPRMTIRDIIQEPLDVLCHHLTKKEKYNRVVTMMERVGLSQEMMTRYPHEFSGGQCQRIGIARALITEPKLVICDEPVSALDISIQAQIINLLQDLQDNLGLTLIFISHDLSVVRHLCDRVMVMYLGNCIEIASTDQLFESPSHSYTQLLLSAIPVPDPKAKNR